MEWTYPDVKLPSTTEITIANIVCRSSDMSATIRLEVYASFEFQPMLGSGEQLQMLTTTVGQLLDRSTNDVCEWDAISHKSMHSQRYSVYVHSKGRGRRIPVLILFHNGQTAEARERQCINVEGAWPPLGKAATRIYTFVIDSYMPIVNH